MILTINRETGTIHSFHRLAYVIEAHSVICEVQTESLCYRSSGPHEYSEIRLLFSEGQAGEGNAPRDIGEPWAMSTLCPQTKSCPSPN